MNQITTNTTSNSASIHPLPPMRDLISFNICIIITVSPIYPFNASVIFPLTILQAGSIEESRFNATQTPKAYAKTDILSSIPGERKTSPLVPRRLNQARRRRYGR